MHDRRSVGLGRRLVEPVAGYSLDEAVDGEAIRLGTNQRVLA